MAATEQTEIERKYDVGVAATVPDLTAVDGVASVEVRHPVTLVAVYYDTPALDLAAHSVVLRRREGGGDEGWHVKKPAAEGRTELHWPLDTEDEGDDVPDDVPDAVQDPVRAIVRDRPLSPIARVTTTRTAQHLKNHSGQDIAELADDQVLASDIRGGETTTWREWEVEFLEAVPDTADERTAFLDAVERQLTAVGARPSESRSKLAHTLGSDTLAGVRPRDGVTSAASDPVTLLDAGSAASVIVAALHQQVEAIVAVDPAVRADRPNAVHRMRRAIRTVRSLLAAYRDVFQPAAVDALLENLRRVGLALGEARDAEVRRDRAANLLETEPTEEEVRDRLIDAGQREYDQALGRVRSMLSQQHYFRLLDALEEFVREPPLAGRGFSHSAGKKIARGLRKQVKRLAKRVEVVRADSGGGADGSADAAEGEAGEGEVAADARREADLHEVRKAARRLRLAVTALAVDEKYRPAKRFRAIAKAVKPLEKSLGAHRDGVLLAQQIRIAAQRAEAAGEDTSSYGVLTGNAGESAESLLADLDSVVDEIERLARKL